MTLHFCEGLLILYTHLQFSTCSNTVLVEVGPSCRQIPALTQSLSRQAIPTMCHLQEGDPAQTKRRHRCSANNWVSFIVSQEGTDGWGVGKIKPMSQHGQSPRKQSDNEKQTAYENSFLLREGGKSWLSTKGLKCADDKFKLCRRTEMQRP